MKFRIAAVLGLALSLGCLAGHAEDGPRLSNKWRIECDEGAKSDGTISFRLTPKDGMPIEVSVPITNGSGENKVAQTIKDTLEKSLDARTFHVEVDDGEDVLVKKKNGPDFALEMTGSSVQGTRITIGKE
jgi:hypothetical protein